MVSRHISIGEGALVSAPEFMPFRGHFYRLDGLSSWDTASVRECYTPVDVVRDWREEEQMVRVSTTRDVHRRKCSICIVGKLMDTIPYPQFGTLLNTQHFRYFISHI